MSINPKRRIDIFPFFTIIVYTLMVIMRAPSILFEGRFWGEEGSAFFSDAYSNDTLSTLFSPRFGYYGFLNATVVYFFNLGLNQFWGRIIVLAGVLIIVIGVSYNFIRINDLIKRYQSESLVENKIIDKIKAMQGELGCWVFQYKNASSIAGSLYYGNVLGKPI